MLKIKEDKDPNAELSYKEWAWKAKSDAILRKERRINSGKPASTRYNHKKTEAYKNQIKKEAESEYMLTLHQRNKYKKKKDRPVVYTSEKEFDFLKFYRVVIYWAVKQYKITKSDLELFFFLYNERPFTKAQFDDACYVMTWDRHRFERYIEKGYIVEYAKRGELGRSNSLPIYRLSFSMKRKIKAIYDRLTLRNLISEHGKHTPMFQKKRGYRDKTFAKAVTEMNIHARKMRNGELNYYLEEDLKHIK